MCMFPLEERAENGTRTRDPDLGKVVLYQLSYFRINSTAKVVLFFLTDKYFFDIQTKKCYKYLQHF